METITTTVGQLKQAIKAVLVAVNAKSCDLHIINGKLHVKATNHTGYCRVNIESTGSFKKDATANIAVQAANAIFGTVSADTEVKIVPADKGLRLRFGGSSLKLSLVDPGKIDEVLFSIVHSCEGRELVAECKGADLIEGFASPQSFAAVNDTRQYLCGVYMEDIDGKLCMTGTNGFMLNSVLSNIPCSRKGFNAILPTQAAQAIDHVFVADDDVQIFQVGDGHSKKIVWKTSTLCWVNYLVDGAYPNYKSLLLLEDAPAATDIVVPRKELTNAIARVLALATKRFVGVHYKDGVLSVFSEDEEQKELINVGEMTEAYQPGVEPQEWAALFNGGMLSEVASLTPGANILFRKELDENAKLFVRPVVEQQADSKWVAMLQPVKS